MDYKELIENLKAWDEEYISSACGESSLHCEHFCIPGKDCLVTQAVTAITDLLARAETAEARVHELETSYRLEKCENGPECVELGRMRKALAEAEARAEKAERERDAYKEMIYKERPCAFCVEYTGEWNAECLRCDRCTKEYRPQFRLRELKEE